MFPLLLALAGCAADEAPPAPPVRTGPEPAWPTTIAEAPAPAGYTWQTVRHETVHARLLVPDGADVTTSDPGAESPTVRIRHRVVTAELTYSPHSAWLAPRADPSTPTFASQSELPDGGLRVSGHARGVACVADLGPFDRLAADEARTICGSVRPPPLGAWAPSAGVNRTAVPGGAWVAPDRPEVVGESLLGPYAPRLYAGWFGIAHGYCADPATFETLADGEAEVKVTRHDTPVGPAYLRLARADRDGVRFVSGARVVAPRGQGCCIAEIFPFGEPPSAEEVAYVVDLCDTTGL